MNLYARVYTTTGNNNNGLYQPCRFQRFEVYKNYPAVFTRSNGYTFYWDDEAKAPYYYNAEKKIFATFDDARSAKLKTQYAIDKGLSGILFWELRQDNNKNNLLNAIAEVKKMNKMQIAGQ